MKKLNSKYKFKLDYPRVLSIWKEKTRYYARSPFITKLVK